MKPSIPQGTRDFSAEVVRKRQYIFNTIRNVYELYGYQPLETPAMENIDTLMGKYGEEGDKLIFRILNNGLDNPAKEEKTRAALENVLQGKLDKNITERALRYDLTIPFARYVAMNFGALTFPFRRYQIQPVWRADRPQYGRYREFYQCDADVVGNKSLLCEAEFCQIYGEVFQRLQVPVEIHINNRKVLAALAEACGGSDKLVDITVAIDKLDKIGLEKVKEELTQRGLNDVQISIIAQYLQIEGSNEDKIAAVRNILLSSELGQKGLAEIEKVLQLTGRPGNVVVDFTLARGLNYYTGIIFEIKAIGVKMGSIGGGGRYDDLTGLFGVPDLPGVGISFGIDRIYDVMESLHVFPESLDTATKVLFFNLGEAESLQAFLLAQNLRQAGISCEIFPDAAKFDKQFRYADKKNIPFVVIIGSQELSEGNAVVKNIQSGEQKTFAFDKLAGFLTEWSEG